MYVCLETQFKMQMLTRDRRGMSADSWRLSSARQQEAGRSEENPADTRLKDTPSKQILLTYFQSTMPTAENSSGLGFGVGAPRERQMHSTNGTKLM